MFFALQDHCGLSERAGREGRRHDRGRASRNEEGTALPIKIVAPRGAVKTLQSHADEIIQQFSRFHLGFLRHLAAIVRERGQGEQRDALRVSFARHASEAAQIDRRTLKELDPGQAGRG